MSGTLSSPPPTPGFVAVPVAVGSCLPRPFFNGEPMSSPCPAIVRQLTPSWRPMIAHVSPDILTVPLGAPPGKPRKVEAILPDGAAERNCDVSYQPVLVALVFCGLVS